MTPAVAEVVKVAERHSAAAVEIKQAYLALVEGTRAVRETILVQKLRIAIPQAAWFIFGHFGVTNGRMEAAGR